ncbi:hypothetical protein M409DRAFT_69144 [Zasmidium cellare ATCC 36951]|uniref:C6 transcription factor RegA n=1 Tax=Zasmidium cellare ATCC 36951 TaxID=1080233 RepID=A0A6A6C6D1_ZASCE|nr:uncharacterized protein M409DRAFT_69144 [Zasmidium cellare ATCC 36951]KAF2162585.1 hypothetical protein M409DRAFT_69144 [Zasmidium cellare ATCC 36951]
MSLNTPGDATYPSNGTNPFVCNVCQKTYGRIDHLARHFRSHTNEKPFRCDECGKTFARADLLKRHATLHTSTEQSGKKRKIRASQACTQCATIKVKCDQEKPCKRCKTKGLECRVDASSSSTMYRSDDHDSPPEQLTGQSDFRTYPSEQHQLSGPTSTPANISHASVVQPVMMPGSHHPAPIMEDPSLSDFLKDVLHPAEQAHVSAQPRSDTTWNGNFAPRDLMDFSQDLSLDFNDLDAVLSGGWDTWLDPSLVPAVYDKPTDRTVSDGSTPSIDGSINMGSAAYNRSAWKWVPDAGKGKASKDQSLASILIDGKASGEMQLVREGPRSQLLTPQDRDRIVALLLSSCDKPNFQKVVTMFPGVNVLDFFLHECLVTMEHSIDSWMHIPTFRSSDAIPELLTSMIAQGAVLSRTSHAQLFGYALQEKGRLALPELFERDNSMTRNLQALQASAICLDIGTWSGNKRTMELAEAAALPLVTMIRRSGGFRRSRGVAPGPSPEHSKETLQQKWRTWVEAESFKRLAYHVFLYTVQVSVAFQTPPLLSYAEITLELPAPQAVWRAKSAEEWRDQYFAYVTGGPLPTFVSSMCSPETMGFFRGSIDLELTLYLVLLSHWCLAWEYTQLSSANKAQANDIQWAGTMLASAKCQELCKLLDSFYVVIEDWGVFIPKEVHMMSQLLRMNLCVALEDLQLIAGKEGEEEARRVYPSLKQWYRSPECRQALWHAGQVLRAARRPAGRSPNAAQSAPPDAPWLRDFNAVALYHAGLAFWVYGLLSRAISSEDGYNNGQSLAVDYGGDHIRLDGDDEELTNMDRHQFIGLNKGRAVISAISPWSNVTSTRVNGPGSSPPTTVGTAAARGPVTEPPHTRQETVPLDDPKLVMDVMIHALTPSSQPPGTSGRSAQPQQSAGPQRPAMVENLVQLMRDLGEAASAV